MKLDTVKQDVKDAVGAASAVVSDEISIVSPAWKAFVPKWVAYPLTKKVIAVAVPVLALGIAYWAGAVTLGGIAHTLHLDRSEAVAAPPVDLDKMIADKIQAKLTPYITRDEAQKQIAASADALMKTVGTETPSASRVDELEANLKKTASDVKALQKKKTPKGGSAQITTGSISKSLSDYLPAIP